MLRYFFALTLLATPPAMAEERKLSGVEIRIALSDKIVEGTDDSGRRYTQIFQKGGLTIFNVMPTSSSNGIWDVRGDQFCSQWPPSTFWTCYDMMATGTVLKFIAPDGKIWPVTILD